MSNPDGTQNEVNRFGRKYKPGLLAGGAVLLARALNIVAARLSPRQWHHLRLRRPTKQERQRALIRECVRQEVTAEFDRQKAADDAIWAEYFRTGAGRIPGQAAGSGAENCVLPCGALDLEPQVRHPTKRAAPLEATSSRT
jgi:hypothetical protein